MRIESKLCHITENKAVVQVIGWLKEENLGSTLAEGPTVEVAEDKAISRLNKRLKLGQNIEVTKNNTQVEKLKTPVKVELPVDERNENANINNDPCDWSNELIAIDSEIKRLNWSRDDEISFLEKTLGYNNRNKITDYCDIVKYLDLLKTIDNKNISLTDNSNISSLINESENILRDLSWDHKKGREYLQKEFNVSTRKELNESQLLSFVEQLKLIRNQYINNLTFQNDN